VARGRAARRATRPRTAVTWQGRPRRDLQCGKAEASVSSSRKRSSEERTCVRQKHTQGNRGATEAGSATACLQTAWRPGFPSRVRPRRVLGVGRRRPQIVMRLRFWQGEPEGEAAKQRRRSGRNWTSASADASGVFYRWPTRLVSAGVCACKATGHAHAGWGPLIREQVEAAHLRCNQARQSCRKLRGCAGRVSVAHVREQKEFNP
jgi:hypothetical protein